MAVPAWYALGGRDGGRPVMGGARGSARAAARRAPQGAKAELPVRLRRVSSGRLRPPRRARRSSLRPLEGATCAGSRAGRCAARYARP
jgi:hypothetical protein